MKKLKSLLLTLMVVVICKIGFTQTKSEFKIYRMDESKTDSSLLTFIEKLKRISLTKDTSRLYETLDKNIVTSYGGMQIGKRDFISNWQLNDPDSSKVWEVIISLVKLGGVFDTIDDKKVFCLPYANANKLMAPIIVNHKDFDFDPYFTFICLKENVPVYIKPDKKSAIVGHLSYDIVSNDLGKGQKQDQANSTEAYWICISTFDRRIRGWVTDNDFYPLGDWKIVIEKINNEWKITSFSAYD